MPKRLFVIALVGGVLGACGTGAPDATTADTTYGPPVDATEAVPAPAVAAEGSLYVGHRTALDGQIAAVGAAGCEVILETDGRPLVVSAPRTDATGCAWAVPEVARGLAVAAGTLRAAGDTLRLTANGVRVTPVRLSEPDS
ncbi:MAG: hypothetical protein V5A20_13845 [Salinibacter sp.]|uniref:hypothetical protein n=1 Tax=Salinibacter sp. TaxID=2065818 RepID=UPI002FC2A256